MHHISFQSAADNTGVSDLRKFVFNYQIKNTVGADIVVSYMEFGWVEQITLGPDEILDWFRIFRATQEPQFTLTAVLKGSGMSLLIAGKSEFVMKSMPEENLLIFLPVTVESEYDSSNLFGY